MLAFCLKLTGTAESRVRKQREGFGNPDPWGSGFGNTQPHTQRIELEPPAAMQENITAPRVLANGQYPSQRGMLKRYAMLGMNRHTDENEGNLQSDR